MTDEEMKATVEKLTASVEALERKNAELIAEKKKAKEEADAAREAAEEAAEKAASNSTSVDEVKASLTKLYQKDIAKLTKQLEDTTGQLSTVLIDNAIKDHLVQNNIAPQFHKAVSLMLKSEAKLENGEALVNGTPLAEHIKSFVGSDEGKHFVSAPANSGAGAVGSKTGLNVSQLPGEWNLSKYIGMKNDNPALAADYAKKFEQNHLLGL